MADTAMFLNGVAPDGGTRLLAARKWLTDSGLSTIPSDPKKRDGVVFGHYIEPTYGTLNVIQPFTSRLRLDPHDILARDVTTNIFYRITSLAFERDYIYEPSTDGLMMTIYKKN